MQEEAQLTEWNRKLEQDTETLKAAANRQHLRMVMGASNVDCDDLASIDIRTHLLTHESMSIGCLISLLCSMWFWFFLCVDCAECCAELPSLVRTL
jgi:hypothetical protein